MVLEALLNPFTIKHRPWEMFFGGVAYSIVGLLLSYVVFREVAGILLVFFIVLAVFPAIYTSLKNEQELDIRLEREWPLLKEHAKVIIFLTCLFLGIVVGLFGSYVFLPDAVVAEIFSLQTNAIAQVTNSVQASMTSTDVFWNLVINNMKVLLFCVLFSFLYGTGAIFVLTWNASVIAVAMGNFVKTQLASSSIPLVSTYFSVTALGFARYMTHGFFEVFAYFLAGLAGGIISISLLKHSLKNPKVIKDVSYLLGISVVLLFVAALVEAYITPVLIGL